MKLFKRMLVKIGQKFFEPIIRETIIEILTCLYDKTTEVRWRKFESDFRWTSRKLLDTVTSSVEKEFHDNLEKKISSHLDESTRSLYQAISNFDDRLNKEQIIDELVYRIKRKQLTP